MYDILVVNKDYEAEGSDSISVKAGDLVEVIDMGSTDQGAKYVDVLFCTIIWGSYINYAYCGYTALQIFGG